MVDPGDMNVAIVGAGTMGARIAKVFAPVVRRLRVFDPVVTDVPADVGYEFSDDLASAIDGAHLVVEAIPENLAAKTELFAAIDGLNASAVIASNTSTFLPSVLARELRDPSRLLVAHFFHPADVIPLVEVVPSPDTADSAVELVTAVLERAGKRVVRLAREIDGFVANRLQAAVIREAAHLVETGVVTPAQLDVVMKTSIGPRWALMGPFEVMDRGGLDVWQAVLGRLLEQLCTDGEAAGLVSSLVGARHLGVKSGSGFHTYGSMSPSSHQVEVAIEQVLQIAATDSPPRANRER